MDSSNGAEKTNGISADEVALYDRQIRLWGMEAQERMRNAHVLLISMKALANEIAKNLVLAGIGALTVMDHETVTEDDLGAQFFITQADVGRNRAVAGTENAQKLNPRVSLHADTENVSSKTEEYFTRFDVVVACNLNLHELIRINNACRAAERPFYAAEIPGMTGYIFADLVEHNFVTEREETSKSGERQKVSVPSRESYISLQEALTHEYGATLRPKLRKKVSPVLPLTIALLQTRGKAESNQDFASTARGATKSLALSEDLLKPQEVQTYLANSQCELSAIAAIVGGVLSQDVLNVLSRRETPIQNFFIYDGNTGEGPIYKL